jgi:hypothetical protein
MDGETKQNLVFRAVFQSRIGFNADPDPAFMSMRILSNIQSFDDQKLEIIYSWKKFVLFWRKIAI